MTNGSIWICGIHENSISNTIGTKPSKLLSWISYSCLVHNNTKHIKYKTNFSVQKNKHTARCFYLQVFLCVCLCCVQYNVTKRTTNTVTKSKTITFCRHTKKDTKGGTSYNSAPVAWSVGKVNGVNTYGRTQKAHTNTHVGERTSLLLRFGPRAKFVRERVHRPPLSYHTAARACVHLWKTWRLFSHTAQLSLYLQMVLGKNVTFDSVPRTKRALQWKAESCFFFFFWTPKPDKWAHDCLHDIRWV